MKKILILLIATILLASCFGSNTVEGPEDIVSNVIDINTEISQEETLPEEEEVENSWSWETVDDNQEAITKSDNDTNQSSIQEEASVTNTETSDSSVEPEISSDTQQDIKIFEEELESLFDDIFEASEG